MLRALKRHRTLIAIAGLILIPLAVYRANSVEVAKANPFERFVLTITAPLERLLASSTEFVADVYSSYLDLKGARAENVELRRKLNEIERRLDESTAIAQENERLRKLLKLRDRNPSLELLSASVVAAGQSLLYRTIRIDRGLADGLRPGMPVLGQGGLLGRLQRVAFRSSEVLLIADERVSFEVVVARSRVRGRLRGESTADGFRLRVRNLLRTDDVKVDDQVLTSGLAGVFPRGIPVGKVVRAEAVPGDQDLLVEVEPAVDMRRLEEVMVITARGDEEDLVMTPKTLLPEGLRSSTVSVAEPKANVQKEQLP